MEQCTDRSRDNKNQVSKEVQDAKDRYSNGQATQLSCSPHLASQQSFHTRPKVVTGQHANRYFSNTSHHISTKVNKQSAFSLASTITMARFCFIGEQLHSSKTRRWASALVEASLSNAGAYMHSITHTCAFTMSCTSYQPMHWSASFPLKMARVQTHAVTIPENPEVVSSWCAPCTH